MPEKYKIQIEGEDRYDNKFTKKSDFTEREYMGLITTILDYIDKVQSENRKQD